MVNIRTVSTNEGKSGTRVCVNKLHHCAQLSSINRGKIKIAKSVKFEDSVAIFEKVLTSSSIYYLDKKVIFESVVRNGSSFEMTTFYFIIFII